MTTLRRTLIVTAAAALIASAAPAAELFARAEVRLEATRYLPAEDDLRWQGWIGGGASLLETHGVSLWGRAEVETVLGQVIRSFEATQANYHLTFGLRRTFGRCEVAPFFHHSSRHYVDRPKTHSVDANFLGAQVSGQPWSAPVWLMASLAHTTHSSLANYEWEVRAAVEAAVWRHAKAAALLRGGLRVVTVRDNGALPRGDFADWTVEGAWHWENDGRALEAYVAAEKRNDVFLETPGSRQRALLGVRLLLNRPRPNLQL